MPPDAHITGTPFAVIFGLTYNFIPFMSPADLHLARAARPALRRGGQRPVREPVHDVLQDHLPLSLPGHRLRHAAHLHPGLRRLRQREPASFLGGPDTQMIGNVIEANFLVLLNYPAAAALSIILMAAILVLVSIYVKRTGTEDLL